MVPALLEMSSEIIQGAALPHSFLEALVIPLRKKGGSADALEYRPIYLLQTRYKIFAKVLVTRLQSVLPTLVGDSQQGFVLGRQMHRLVSMMLSHLASAQDEKDRTVSASRVIMLLDFLKAYDTVDREAFYATLREFHLDAQFARCVVMVGMPYPNARDPEIVEKMGFLEKRSAGAGRQFYESLCMKAINQSIGNVLLYISAHCKLPLLTRVGIPNVQEGLFAIKMISLPFCWSTIATQVRPFAVAYQSGSKSACSHQCHSGKCTCSSYNSIEQKETKVWQPRDNLLNRQQADVALHCQSVLFC